MTKEYLLYDLSELPDDMTLDDVVKKYKDEKIILVNAGQTVNSKVIVTDVTDEEIEKEVNKRVNERIKRFCDGVQVAVANKGQVFAMNFADIMDYSRRNNIKM